MGPLLPLLLLGAAVGGGAYLITKNSGGSGQPMIKDGVKYGPQCSTIQIVDIATYMKRTQPKVKSLQDSLNPDMPAKEALRKTAKVLFPGPGCSWATDLSFNCTFLLSNGEADGTWKDLLVASGDMSLGQAIQSGAWGTFADIGQQSSEAPSDASSAFQTLLNVLG